MKLQGMFKKTEKLIIDNSPLILTAIGVIGVAATAYFTHKASFKAAESLRELKLEKTINTEGPVLNGKELILTPRETIERVWKFYLPAVGVGVTTIAAIIFANRIGMKRAAAMATALTLAERAHSEYKDKVVEQLGLNKATKVHDAVVQDHIDSNPVSGQQVIVTGGGDVLCYDNYTGRYFMSSMETIKKAENDINYQILHREGASLTEFYGLIGLGRTKTSDDVGWNGDHLLELIFTTTFSDDNRPCIAVDFHVVPYHNFHRVH